jgi:hypothetical protein
VLDEGDLLLTSDGTYLTVGGLDEATTHTGLAYNLTVADIHTYFVVVAGADVLVHNTGCGGPGEVTAKTESMNDAPREFQQKVTGMEEGTVYRVVDPTDATKHVDFDGFANGEFLEAKGNFKWALDGNGGFKPFTPIADDFVNQARRQVAAAGDTPVRWIFEQQEVADAAQRLFADDPRLAGILIEVFAG